MNIKKELIEHLEKFLLKKDISVQWAKDVESILDKFEILDKELDEFQEYLSLYQPWWWSYLYDEKEMERMCKKIIIKLQSKN